MMVFYMEPLFKDIHLEVYKLYIYLVGIYQVKQSCYTFTENLQSINKKPLSNISAE